MNEKCLVIEELCFGYNSQTVLSNINLSVKQSSIVAIVGGSGAGKTTLLKNIMQLVKPHYGKVNYFNNNTIEVQFNSENLEQNNFPQKTPIDVKAIRNRIGYVPQNSVLLPYINILSNVTLPLTDVFGIEHNKALALAHDALKSLGIDKLSLSRPWEVSGGQLQRAAIARAMVVEPEVYLLDEPTGALDAANIEIVGTALQNDVKRRGCSVIVVTHNLGFAQKYCDEVCILQSGEMGELMATSKVDWQELVSLIM